MLRIALYSATIGQYEQPTDILSDALVSTSSRRVDRYRFTDAQVNVTTQRTRDAQPRLREIHDDLRVPCDPIRSARAIKILGHSALSEYDVTVWIDNRVRLKKPVEELVQRFLPEGVDLAVPLHSYHRSLSAEFAAVLSGRFDDPRRVREQRSAYAQAAPQLFAQPVYWTAILIRRNTDAVRTFNSIWWEQVLRHSRRDQLSFPYARAVVPNLRLASFAVDNFESDFHEWRNMSDVGRQIGAGQWTPSSLSVEVADTARFLKDALKKTSTTRREILAKRLKGRS